jgi:hypothetical protein
MGAGSTLTIMLRKLVRAGMFLTMMVLMTILCTFVWQVYVNERLYDCTDAVRFDYLHPGDWVHGRVVVVREIVHNRSMSDPDTIKQGWSVNGLCVCGSPFLRVL